MMGINLNALAGAVFAIHLLLPVHGLGQPSCVTFQSSNESFPVVSNGNPAPVLLSSDDWPGVHRAALDFASDIEKVTGVKPQLINVTSEQPPSSGSRPIIVGTLGRSALIEQVVNTTKLDVSSIEGLWEGFLSKEVANPLPGVESAYVIIGSSKRGTIFGMYDHSEQFGVSPWYWWADVPTTKRDEIYLDSSGCSHGPPTVQYRGIFLNDEQPALQNWAAEKFTNGTGSKYFNSPFNHIFYEKLFELILRMKGNYLWPGMFVGPVVLLDAHDFRKLSGGGQILKYSSGYDLLTSAISAFCVDDDENQPLADYYGIVMGTRHGLTVGSRR
ncbi:hypothetical protein V5O48_018632, partial [Marasmius crinis-equi]